MASTRRRVFLIQEVPIEWNKQELVEQLDAFFSGCTLRIDSVCKHPTIPSKTALVTFTNTVPSVLSTLMGDFDDSIALEIGNHELIFGQCLGLITLFETCEGDSTKAE